MSTYYINAASGNDSTGAGTSGSPWATYAKGFAALASGDTLFMYSGNYTFVNPQGDYGVYHTLFSSYTTIKAVAGQTPVFTNRILIGDSDHIGTGTPQEQMAGAYDVYMVFDGVTAADSIWFEGARHVQVKNCIIRTVHPKLDGTSAENLARVNKNGVTLKNSADVTIDSCDITDCGNGIAFTKSQYCLAKNCTIYNVTQDGAHFESAQYCVFDGLQIHNCDDGVEDGQIDPSTGSTFEWNVHCDGIQIQHYGGALPLNNQYNIVRNCRIWNTDRAGIQFNNYQQYSGDPWQTATSYSVGTKTYYNGTSYTCAIAHTSGVFATDLSAGKWTSNGAMVQNSDMVFENNLFGPNGAYSINSADVSQRLMFRHNSLRHGSSSFYVPNAYTWSGQSLPRTNTATLGTFRYSAGSATSGEGLAAGGGIYNNIFATVAGKPDSGYEDYNLVEDAGGMSFSYGSHTLVQTNGSNFSGAYTDPAINSNSPAVNGGTRTAQPADPAWYTSLISYFGLSASALTIDILGNTRDATPDMGAYEYGGSAPQTAQQFTNLIVGTLRFG